MKRYTMRHLHAVFAFDASSRKNGACQLVARRVPAVITTVSPRLSLKPLTGRPDFESCCHQYYFQLNTVYGEACEGLRPSTQSCFASVAAP